MRKITIAILIFTAALLMSSCKKDEENLDPQFVWSGLEEKIITRGDQIDLLEGVTVTDKKDGVLTKDILITDDDGFSTHLAAGYKITYEVTNSEGTKDTVSKNIIVRVGHNVANGDFELNKFGWTLDAPGGKASMNVINKKMVVDIKSSGTAWWAIQIKQEGVVFTAGKVYRMTVTASSEQGHSIAGGYEDPNNGFRMLNPGFQTMPLTSEAKTYEMYYRAAESFSNVKVVIYLGHMLPTDSVKTKDHQVIIEKINIEEVDVNQRVSFEGYTPRETASSGSLNDLNLREGVIVKHNGEDVTADLEILGTAPTEILAEGSYYITYLYRLSDGSVAYAIRRFDMKLAKDKPYQVVNGDFEQGFTGWIQDVNQTNGTGAATFVDNGDGTVSVTVDNVSNAGWHIQLQQAGASLEQGKSYIVRLVIKSSEERNIDIEIVDPSNAFAPITPTLEGATVGTDWTTFEIEFTALANFHNAKISILLGNVDGMQTNGVTVTVDEFQVYILQQD